MKLHELKPAEGSTRVRRRVGSPPAVRKARTPEPAAAYVRDLKAARCLCTVVFQSAASKIFSLKNTPKLMLNS